MAVENFFADTADEPDGFIDLGGADGIGAAIAWLSAHPRVTANLGGEGRVNAYNEPPYKRLRITHSPGGSDRELRWLLAQEATIEALGDLDGTHSPDELRRTLYLALGALCELPEATYSPGEPVVTAIQSSSPATYSPLPNGQHRYITTVLILVHPPTESA